MFQIIDSSLSTFVPFVIASTSHSSHDVIEKFWHLDEILFVAELQYDRLLLPQVHRDVVHIREETKRLPALWVVVLPVADELLIEFESLQLRQIDELRCFEVILEIISWSKVDDFTDDTAFF